MRRQHNPLVPTVAVLSLSTLWFSCGEASLCDRGEVGAICAVAGTGALGFNGDERQPEDTDFYLPTRARRGPDGLLYFMDFNNWRVRRLDSDGLIRTIAGNGSHAAAFDGAPALETPLDNPTDFDFSREGELVMVSFEDPRVLTIRDGTVYAIAGTGEVDQGLGNGDGGPPELARFAELMGIAVGEDGAIYLADSGANRVRVIRDGIIDTLAGNGEAGYSGDGGPATAAALDYPTAVAVDEGGTVYIADTRNHAVRRVAPDGTIETIAGIGEPGLSGDGGPAAAARLREPNGVAIGDDATLYIADRSNFRVRRVGRDGLIDTLAGTREGYAGDGGRAEEAELGYLARLTWDGDGLIVADQSNGCFRFVYLGLAAMAP